MEPLGAVEQVRDGERNILHQAAHVIPLDGFS
jgi:hypothetical protein